MSAKKCPLCGGKLKNNYCESCGYDVPADDDLSAVYDMEPENDAFGEQVREITPKVQTEEIYPNREPPKFKVRDEEGKTVQQNYQNQVPPPSPFAQQNRGSGYNTPPNTGAQNRGGNYAPPPSPYANQGNQSGQYATAGDFVKAYWWMLLLSFLAPIVGIILLVTVGKSIEKKYRGIVIAAIVLGFFLPP